MSSNPIGKTIIEKLEKKRKSKVISYITSDKNPIHASIAEDAVRPIYDHLLELDFGKAKEKNIDLFIYSRGGDVGVPWRIASMIREFCDKFSVIVPYKAHSAATLLSLGADEILMGRKAELSPIDPIMVKTGPGQTAQRMEISVEDVNSYLSFITERAKITDQSALTELLKLLINHITPTTIGAVNRQNSHIRLVARKLLTSRLEKMDEERIDLIIETLTEKIYSHGHAIGRTEAKEVGLPIEFADDEDEELIWSLYLEYEKYFDMNNNLDPETELGSDEEKIINDLPLAAIESAKKLHIFKANLELKRIRNVPSSPQLNISVNMQLPAGVTQPQTTQQLQQLLQQLMPQLTSQVTQQVTDQLIKQSPTVNFNVRTFAQKWDEEY